MDQTYQKPGFVRCSKWPKLTIVATLLVFGAVLAQARTEPLEAGTSPNCCYRVQVTQRGTPSEITYDLVRSRDGTLLHRFKSSYQPEEGELPNWSWNHSASAGVAWSPNSHYVSIDEEVHHYTGEVLLAELTSQGAQAIKFPVRAIAVATKRQWDRQRIRYQRGWISPNKLSLVFAGKEAGTYKEMYFEIILHVRAGRAFVVSCHDITNQT